MSSRWAAQAPTSQLDTSSTLLALLRLSGEEPGAMPMIPRQREDGAFLDPGGTASTAATGIGLCHLSLIELQVSDAARRAGDWLEGAKTPSQAWTDTAEHVPGELTTPGGIEVWATAAATCGLLSLGRDPGPRAIDLLRGEADLEGRVTGGAYPTFAAAAAYWLAEGPTTEMAEWGLRWARENAEEWGPEAWASALVFWGPPAYRPTISPSTPSPSCCGTRQLPRASPISSSP